MSSSPTETLVDVTMPQMGVSVAEGTVVAWRVEPGDRIEAEATICEISTDKIDTEVPSPASGVVTEILVPIGETVDVGTVMARIAVGGAARRLMAAPRCGALAWRRRRRRDHRAVPAARWRHRWPLGHRNKIIITRPVGSQRRSEVLPGRPAHRGRARDRPLRVPGTGRGGRVRKQDVMAFVDVRSGRGAAAPHREPVPARPGGAPAPAAPLRSAVASFRGCAGRSAST